LVSKLVTPTGVGEVFVLVQAVAVAVFAFLEYDGLRRHRASLGSGARRELGVSSRTGCFDSHIESAG
jgi:hypothetical protein